MPHLIIDLALCLRVNTPLSKEATELYLAGKVSGSLQERQDLFALLLTKLNTEEARGLLTYSVRNASSRNAPQLPETPLGETPSPPQPLESDT